MILQALMQFVHPLGERLPIADRRSPIADFSVR
jgi:hypothetical protein